MFRSMKARLSLIIASALLLESVALPVFFHEFLRVDFFVILLVFYVFYVRRDSALALALVLGLVKDLFSNNLFGVQIFSYGMITLFLIWISRKFDRENRVVMISATAISSLITLLISLPFCLSSQAGFHGFWVMVGKGVLTLLWTTLFSWPLIHFFYRFITQDSRQLAFRF